MGLFDKALEKMGYTKANGLSTNDPALVALLGLEGNDIVQPYGNIPAVYKSIKAIIDNVAQIRIQTVDQEKNIVSDKGINQLLSNIYDETGVKIGVNEFIQKITGQYCLYGEIFIQKMVTDMGQLRGTRLPDSIKVLSPQYMTPLVVDNSIDSWTYGMTSKGQQSLNIPSNQLIIIKDFNPYLPYRGLSPIKVILDQLKIENSSSKYQISLFENDAMPGLVLEYDKTLNPDQRNQIRQAWEARHKGSKNVRKMAILEGGMKANMLAMSPQDMQFDSITNAIEQQIIGTWRVPKAMFGHTDGLNYATFLGQLRVFWEMTIIPIVSKIESSLNSSLISGYNPRLNIHFDLGSVPALRDNINELVASAQTLGNLGFTGNEINKRLNLGFEDKPWRDVSWIPFSLVPAGSGSIADQTPTDTTGKSKKKGIVASNGLEYGEKQYAFSKNFNHLHDKIHVRFRSGLRKYFNGQRKRFLDAFDNTTLKYIGKAVHIDIKLSNEAEIYKKEMKLYYDEAIKDGAKTGEQATGLPPSARLDIQLNKATERRMNFVAEDIQRTTVDHVNSLVNQGIDNGDSVDDIKNSIKGYFNEIDNRSEVIARTEVTAQLNGGLMLQYDDVGIEQKEWVANIDAYTRESHEEMNGEVVPLNEPFSNGLMYPGDDGEPEDTINCRCSVYPVN